jgi:thiol:disulfide interchange protein DsbD
MEIILSKLELFIRESHFFALLFSFLAGVLTSFTPCSYPMIPITLGFIGSRTTQSKRRGFVLAFFYVFGLAIVYSVIGAIAALTGRMFGSFTNRPIVYFIIGNICIGFGLAMFEVFHLPSPRVLDRFTIKQLPGSEILSSIILGGSSAIVISTCTTPVLGLLLTVVASKGSLILGMGMLFLFAYGLGFLVILMGTFAGLLASLPKSGPWLRTVQKVFGVVMIGAGEYFLIKMGELLI